MSEQVLRPGNTALVTGGASGIGLGIAQALIQAGMTVIVTDVRKDHMETARASLASAADRALILPLDVADPAQWQDVRRMVETRFGSLHLLCLNAGVGVLGSMLDSDDADWTWLTSVNLGGVLNGIAAFLPHMIEHGQAAHIVATSSMGGLVVANDGGIYSSAKFGVVGLIEDLGRRLIDTAVRASVLCPAAVATNIFDHERMRPDAFLPEDGTRDLAAIAAGEAFARQILAMGRSPIEVGAMVCEAIRRDEPYVFTDCNVRSTIERRRDALLAFA